MDYKELIERIEDAYEFAVAIEEDDLFTTLEDAATALETLLAEREAAVRDLTSICEESGDACHLCKYLPCASKHDGCIGWQWRGPTLPDRQQTES